MNRKLVIKPITTTDFNERAQIDMVDFQSVPDGKFKYILNYQDHATKFVILRSLQIKRATHLDLELQKYYTMTMAAKSVINEPKNFWPECVIVHGQGRHPQSLGNIERSNQDVKHMLRT
jgi:hypothetical protein